MKNKFNKFSTVFCNQYNIYNHIIITHTGTYLKFIKDSV